MKPIAIVSALLILAALTHAAETEAGGVIQTVPLEAGRAYFIPTHARVTTTIRFPGAIGNPDGAVGIFTEDATKQTAEYLVTWQVGDPYFTIAPLDAAQMANLNVPYEGRTYVFYFFPVADPLKAVAAVSLSGTQGAPELPIAKSGAPAPNSIRRAPSPPVSDVIDATPARLVGLLDRLKLVHATPRGEALVQLARAMQIQIALGLGASDLPSGAGPSPAVSNAADFHVTDTALFQIHLLRVIRDPRLNCLGFICLVRNTSRDVLAFDPRSFAARAGAQYLPQRVVDAASILKPGEQAPAYFVAQPARATPLSPDNDWRISVDLVSPCLNPGAVIARGYLPRGKS